MTITGLMHTRRGTPHTTPIPTRIFRRDRLCVQSRVRETCILQRYIQLSTTSFAETFQYGQTINRATCVSTDNLQDHRKDYNSNLYSLPAGVLLPLPTQPKHEREFATRFRVLYDLACQPRLNAAAVDGPLISLSVFVPCLFHFLRHLGPSIHQVT